MSDNACRHLPVSIVSQATTSGDREKYVVNFLENLLPSSDTKSIGDELRKTFTFNKYRTQHGSRKSKKAKFLSVRKRAVLGLNKLQKKTSLKYADGLRLNELWLSYMRQMLGVDNFKDLPQQPTNLNWDGVGQQLLKADFHGAKIAVIKSKCPSLVGVNGIIIQDTKSTFRVLGEDNIIRTIPKEVVMFNIYLGDTNLQLYGKELCVRPAERSVKKFKTAHMPDL